MNPQVSQLIAHICRQIVDRGGYPTKTKILKLLYLFDVAYYRRHQVTFTGFNWVFLHFGPWTNEFDPLLIEAEKHGLVSLSRGERAEYVNPGKQVEIEDILPSYADEFSLRRVLDTWAEEPLNRILDYVYFNTEPMIHGTRSEPLDFSKISETVSRSYDRQPPIKSPGELETLKDEILKRIRERDTTFKPKKAERITRDAIFYAGLKVLEETE